jgi:hypothetical protein
MRYRAVAVLKNLLAHNDVVGPDYYIGLIALGKGIHILNEYLVFRQMLEYGRQ